MKTFILLINFLTIYHFCPAQVFFSEDFESVTPPALPSNWTVQTLANDGGYITGDSAAANPTGTWVVPSHTQFAMSNDDICDCNKEHDYLILPIQNFTSIVGGIQLEAQIHNDGVFGGGADLMVSLNGGTTWQLVQNFGYSSNWQNITVSLNAYIGLNNVMIAFHFSDNGFWATGLAVDNVILRQVTGFDDLIALQHQQEYTKIPESQLWNMPLTAKVKNQGTSIAYNARLTTKIYQSPNFTTPIQTLIGNPDTLIPTQIKNLTSGNYQPAGLGTYLFKHIISTTSFSDGNPVNDTVSYLFEVTDSVYARDNNLISYSIDNPGFNNTLEVGQLFDIQLTASMTSLTFGTEGAGTGDTATLAVYYTSGGVPTSQIASYDYIYTAKGFQYTTISTNLILSPGTYMVSIKENLSTDTLGILGTSNIFTDGKAFLSLNGGGFVDMASQGFPAALVLRPNINVPCPSVATNITQIACFGDSNGALSATVSGGMPPFGYLWSNGNTNDAISNLGVGFYYVTLTDANNCIAVDSAEIVMPNPLVINDTTYLVQCADSCDGAAFALVSGGTLPYFYQWDAVANTINYNARNLCPGIYYCTVTDFRGCTAYLTSEVHLRTPIDSIVKQDVTTTGGNDGMAMFYFNDSSWTYLWSTGSSNTSISGLTAGWYSITATDTTGCQYIDSIEISDPPLSTFYTDNHFSIRLYPNPSAGISQLELELTENQAVEIILYNNLGQLLKVWQKQGNKITQPIDLNNYSDGVYWLQMKMGEKQISQKLMLVR